MDSTLSGMATRMEILFSHLTQAAQSSGVRECLELIISDGFKRKIEGLYNVNLEHEMKNLACGDQ